MSNLSVNNHFNQPCEAQSSTKTVEKPVVIGLYGIPGSGKTYLLNRLKQELGQDEFQFFEGSQVIDDVVPGGLKAFKALQEPEKMIWRERAIDRILKSHEDGGRTPIVTGHYMFWVEGQQAPEPVYTCRDLEVYTHILYLDTPPHTIEKRCSEDMTRMRTTASAAHLGKWQETELSELRQMCQNYGILFSVISFSRVEVLVPTLLRDFRLHNEHHNLSRAELYMDDCLTTSGSGIETVLVMDADRTLSADDTGEKFWRTLGRSSPFDKDTLRNLFSGPLGYSYTAFRQAVLLYEEVVNEQEYDSICQRVASTVVVYPEMVCLLQRLVTHTHVKCVVLSCGLRRIWEKVLERQSLLSQVKVVGGGRINDGFVISPAVKRALVRRLKEVYGLRVWAFGDSPLDLEMLKEADEAVVVVGEEITRSRTMDAVLSDAIDTQGLRARQILFPGDVRPRLDAFRLPIINLDDPAVFNSLVTHRHKGQKQAQVLHATEKSGAKLLMTPTREASISGSALREAHRRVGWFLAVEYVSEVVGLEQYKMLHVQGHSTDGYRLLNESQTLIVALMRGGEPMAFGVSDAFPQAMFLHAHKPEEISNMQLEGRSQVILVDSVVNNGNTLAKFVLQIRKIHKTMPIVVVVGVLQAQATLEGSLARVLAAHDRITIVALRVSENKFTGKGGTDTGNRLFNTTHIL